MFYTPFISFFTVHTIINNKHWLIQDVFPSFYSKHYICVLNFIVSVSIYSKLVGCGSQTSRAPHCLQQFSLLEFMPCVVHSHTEEDWLFKNKKNKNRIFFILHTLISEQNNKKPSNIRELTFEPIKYSGNDCMSLSRLGHWRYCGFCFAFLRHLLWGKPVAVLRGYENSFGLVHTGRNQVSCQ